MMRPPGQPEHRLEETVEFHWSGSFRLVPLLRAFELKYLSEWRAFDDEAPGDMPYRWHHGTNIQLL